MKRFLILFLVPVMLLMLLPAPALADTVVNIPDQALKAAICQALNIPLGDVTDTQLATISDLTPYAKNIKSLEGLQYCINLFRLELDGNQITDITPLANLHHLTYFYISNNQISNLSPLAYLTQLQYFGINYNQITDISPLQNLTNLKALGLGWNQISDVSSLANKNKLENISLKSNQITDISALTGLTALKQLDLSNNHITDISVLSSMTNLQTFQLSSNQITSIPDLSALTNLNGFTMGYNQISDISPLNGLTNLHIFDLGYNLITNIPALPNLTNLQNVFLNYNQIQDISGLSSLPALNYAQFNNNQIHDISALAGLNNLQYIWLTNNQITNISPLANVPNLVGIYLNNNQISSVSALNNLTKLQIIGFSSNQIADISALTNLTNLQNLYFSSNQIANVSALASLPNLHNIIFDHNKISSISALVANPGVGADDILNVAYNYLDISPGTQDMLDIQSLINRNVSISYEPQAQFSLTTNVNGQGTVARSPDQAAFYYDASVKLTATPATGWALASWSGDASGSTNPLIVTMDGNKSITANFVGLPSLMVSPQTYSFGDVKVGTTGTTIVTVTNNGLANLSVTIGALSSPFSWSATGDLSQIAPGVTRDISVTYQPSTVGTSTATLSISSNDPTNPLVKVSLSGNGVPAVVPPTQQIADILAFFDQSVANGTLMGSGPGNSANGRLNALRNMIKAAGDLISQGRLAEARQQLQDAYLKVDGNPKPPDFASGAAAAELASRIQQLINSL